MHNLKEDGSQNESSQIWNVYMMTNFNPLPPANGNLALEMMTNFYTTPSQWKYSDLRGPPLLPASLKNFIFQMQKIYFRWPPFTLPSLRRSTWEIFMEVLQTYASSLLYSGMDKVARDLFCWTALTIWLEKRPSEVWRCSSVEKRGINKFL